VWVILAVVGLSLTAALLNEERVAQGHLHGSMPVGAGVALSAMVLLTPVILRRKTP
jgi:hypothetical protein